MSDLEHIKVEWDGEIAVVTIDRAEKLNALNADVLRELVEVFDSLRDDDAVRGVVVTGAGDKAFVAGADITDLAKMTPLTGVEVSRSGQDAFGMVERFPKPVVAAIGGYALGGGLELALACHLRIASDHARFGLPEVGLGLIPGYGGTMRLVRVVGLGHAVEMTLTADMVDAARAHEIGLVSKVVARDDLLAEAKALTRRVTKNGPLAVRMARESIYHALDATGPDALRHESTLFCLLASSEDAREGLAAFSERRKPDFRGR
jgi:enoyl-CoA hydratase